MERKALVAGLTPSRGRRRSIWSLVERGCVTLEALIEHALPYGRT